MTQGPSHVRQPGRAPIAILGVPFDNISTTETLALISEMVASRHPHYAATANVDFVVQALEDDELRHILFNAHLVLCDGMPLVWASRLLGNPLTERVTGSGTVPLLLELAEQKGWRVYFLGGTEASVAAAAAKTRAKHPQLQLVGAYSPPFQPLHEMDHEDLMQRLHLARPDILLVAFGCPKQEKWIAMNYRCANVPFVMGVGATIDFLAGTYKRAPRWMQRTGIEWIFRLLQEPKRLAKRYGKGFRVFGRAILKQWFHLGGRSRPAPPARSPAPPRLALPGLAIIRAPALLDAAAAREHQAAWHQLVKADDALLDLSQTTMADSSGMGLLIQLTKIAREYGNGFALVQPRPKVLAAMELMKLTAFFTLETDFDAARQRILDDHPRAASAMRREERRLALSWQGEVTAATVSGLAPQTDFDLAAAVAGDQVTLDLGQVKFIDSTGLGLMLRLKKQAWQRDVTLVFTNPTDTVRRVLRLARLEEYLLGVPE